MQKLKKGDVVELKLASNNTKKGTLGIVYHVDFFDRSSVIFHNGDQQVFLSREIDWFIIKKGTLKNFNHSSDDFINQDKIVVMDRLKNFVAEMIEIAYGNEPSFEDELSDLLKNCKISKAC